MEPPPALGRFADCAKAGGGLDPPRWNITDVWGDQRFG
ncbi:hypothetical protein SEA_SUCCESS_4 [Streptomyces phage Success]|uniref:Uncharacterized protein n=1 Tax=Streptomyces phage Success TaxID=2999013 RepID=A0A9E8S1V4_9CAUD|nr:hypothetical protein QEH47_gp04 [Streptomyces phage Success]WAB08791.1 hypothetical protein SEA_SUCCESS_4 [Streptomyces phage Success]